LFFSLSARFVRALAAREEVALSICYLKRRLISWPEERLEPAKNFAGILAAAFRRTLARELEFAEALDYDVVVLNNFTS
jgi:hypothetical protein